MTLEATSSATNTGLSPRWEGEVVNGAFPLRRLLGGSDHSQVFLTQYKTRDAAIKIVSADLLPAERRLAQWRLAAGLSHPHLNRLLEVGRWRREYRDFLFVVMEYAD